MDTVSSSPPHYASAARVRAFVAVCFGLSWIPWMVLMLLDASIESGAPAIVFGVATAAPSLAAGTLWLVDRRGRRPRGPRISWVACGLALGLGAGPPVLTALALAGPAAVPPHAAATVAAVGGPLGALAFTMVTGPLSEEFGWRGYLQPRLRHRWGPWGTTLIVGLLWSVWHVPLTFLAGTGQYEVGLFSVEAVVFLASLVPYSFVYLYLCETLGGGVAAAILLHAAMNTALNVFPQPGRAAALLHAGIVVVMAAVAVLLWRRHGNATALRRAAA